MFLRDDNEDLAHREYDDNEPDRKKTISVLFSIDELWALQAFIRHEVGMERTWHYPPSSRSLNDQIALAIINCTKQNIKDAPILLTYHDCLVIDMSVPQNYRDFNNRPVGIAVLIKEMEAREQLLDGWIPMRSNDPRDADRETWRGWLKTKPWEEEENA